MIIDVVNICSQARQARVDSTFKGTSTDPLGRTDGIDEGLLHFWCGAGLLSGHQCRAEIHSVHRHRRSSMPNAHVRWHSMTRSESRCPPTVRAGVHVSDAVVPGATFPLGHIAVYTCFSAFNLQDESGLICIGNRQCPSDLVIIATLSEFTSIPRSKLFQQRHRFFQGRNPAVMVTPEWDDSAFSFCTDGPANLQAPEIRIQEERVHDIALPRVE